MLDVDAVNTLPILAAAEDFLERHQEYVRFVSGPGRIDSVSVIHTIGDIRRSLDRINAALVDAGIQRENLKGTDSDKVSGLGELRQGIKLIQAAIKDPIRLKKGKVFSFDAMGVAKIEHAASYLRRVPEPTRNPEGLSALQWGFLHALEDLEAFDDEYRVTAERIAEEARGKKASSEDYKRPLADLGDRKLVHSKTGRGGGYWLTPQGRKLISQHRSG